jgi:hypothetical protein
VRRGDPAAGVATIAAAAARRRPRPAIGAASGREERARLVEARAAAPRSGGEPGVGRSRRGASGWGRRRPARRSASVDRGGSRGEGDRERSAPAFEPAALLARGRSTGRARLRSRARDAPFPRGRARRRSRRSARVRLSVRTGPAPQREERREIHRESGAPQSRARSGHALAPSAGGAEAGGGARGGEPLRTAARWAKAGARPREMPVPRSPAREGTSPGGPMRRAREAWNMPFGDRFFLPPLPPGVYTALPFSAVFTCRGLRSG